jgi:hypothetical protein
MNINLAIHIRDEAEYYCSACHSNIDAWDRDHDNEYNHVDFTVKEDGEYYCTCNVCEETDVLLITKNEVIERNKVMLKLVTIVSEKIKAVENSKLNSH